MIALISEDSALAERLHEVVGGGAQIVHFVDGTRELSHRMVRCVLVDCRSAFAADRMERAQGLFGRKSCAWLALIDDSRASVRRAATIGSTQVLWVDELEGRTLVEAIGASRRRAEIDRSVRSLQRALRGCSDRGLCDAISDGLRRPRAVTTVSELARQFGIGPDAMERRWRLQAQRTFATLSTLVRWGVVLRAACHRGAATSWSDAARLVGVTPRTLRRMLLACGAKEPEKPAHIVERELNRLFQIASKQLYLTAPAAPLCPKRTV
ncbi:MAG: hypothetical protein K2X99_01635 [Gemmatimonadaceae bacterium]|nr:hypothetical protein [Gemmatimonadaceae bacterium]